MSRIVLPELRRLARPRRTTNSDRVHLTEHQLAGLLDVPREMIRKLKKAGAAHEPSKGDTYNLGLSGLELTAFIALAGYLKVDRFGIDKARRFFASAMYMLPNDHDLQVMMIVVDPPNDRPECQLIHIHADDQRVPVPEEQAAATSVYNLSILKRVVREAMKFEPLKLPKLGDVECMRA